MNGLSGILFLNELELICLHTSIAIVCTQLNGFKYCYITPIILFTINHLFAYHDTVSSITHTKLYLWKATGIWNLLRGENNIL